MRAHHELELVIPGDPVGYYAQGGRRNWDRWKAYTAWKRAVQGYALERGIKLPLVATEAAPVTIETRAYFASGTHPDPENVHKGIKDALFYAPRGTKGSGDKHTGGSYSPPLYDAVVPRVHVVIRQERHA